MKNKKIKDKIEEKITQKIKCPFVDVCGLYSKDSKTCNEDGGMYGSKYAGCWKYCQRKNMEYEIKKEDENQNVKRTKQKN